MVVVRWRDPNETKGKQGNRYFNPYTSLPPKLCGQSYLIRFGRSTGDIRDNTLFTPTDIIHSVYVCERESRGEGAGGGGR